MWQLVMETARDFMYPVQMQAPYPATLAFPEHLQPRENKQTNERPQRGLFLGAGPAWLYTKGSDIFFPV